MIYEMDLNANQRVKLFVFKPHFINMIPSKTSASLKNKYPKQAQMLRKEEVLCIWFMPTTSL